MSLSHYLSAGMWAPSPPIGVLPLPAADMNTLIETMTLPPFCRRGEAVQSRCRCGAAGSHPRQDVVCLGMNCRDHAENPPGTAPMPSPRAVQRSTSQAGPAGRGSPTASSPSRGPYGPAGL